MGEFWEAIQTWWGLVLLPAIGYVGKRMENTYSKAEVKEQIELRMFPLKQTVDRNTLAIERLTEALYKVRIGVPEDQH